MPFAELRYYLELCGDSILCKESNKMITTNGLTYIRSREGFEYYDYKCSNKYIWCRE